MIAEAGLAALWLAAALSLLQLLLTVAHLRDWSDAGQAIRGGAIVQGALALIAFAMLLWVFVATDLSVALVAANSHSAKPLIYKVAGAWGNHEGSMLLWVTVLALAGALLAVGSRRLSQRTLIAALGAQGALALGFYAFLLLASNPFARLNPAAIIELTATPKPKSNVIAAASAIELKAADMIKMPVHLSQHGSWQQAVSHAVRNRERLAQIAASDHYAVCFLENRVEIFNRFRLFDFRY